MKCLDKLAGLPRRKSLFSARNDTTSKNPITEKNMNKNLIIFEKEETSQEIIKSYLAEIPDITIEKIFTEYPAGVKYAKENKPKLAIFAMTSDKTASFKMIKRLADFGINVLVLSEDYTTANIIQTLRYGAKDFVSKPIIKNEFIQSVKKCLAEEVRTMKKSQIISVYSNKGGVGKTVVATNLAVELARLTREKVLLIDLNLPIGDVTTFLDVKPSVNICEIANERAVENVKGACRQYKNSSLYVLAEPPYMEQSKMLTASQVVKLFDAVRDLFAYIVIDMGTNIDKANITILEESDVILLVTVVNLPLIRNCQRCLALFANYNIPADKTKILINRYLDNDEITTEDVEKALNKKVYWKIPNNYYTIMSSINKGIPVSEVNENSNITESFSQLASTLIENLFEKELS